MSEKVALIGIHSNAHDHKQQQQQQQQQQKHFLCGYGETAPRTKWCQYNTPRTLIIISCYVSPLFLSFLLFSFSGHSYLGSMRWWSATTNTSAASRNERNALVYSQFLPSARRKLCALYHNNNNNSNNNNNGNAGTSIDPRIDSIADRGRRKVVRTPHWWIPSLLFYD